MRLCNLLNIHLRQTPREKQTKFILAKTVMVGGGFCHTLLGNVMSHSRDKLSKQNIVDREQNKQEDTVAETGTAD